VVVWEIVSNGEWILPLRDGTEIPSKPPLFHWLGALVSTALGRVDEFTVRFPSALLGLCGVLLTYVTGKRFWGMEAGRTAALVLATNFEWWRTAVAARVDMTLTFFLVAAFLWFLMFYHDQTGARGKALLFALLLGLATLAKGPVGVLLPSLAVGGFLWLRGELRFIKKLRPLAGTTLFLVVAGSWYALALWQGGSRFFWKQIVEENFIHFVDPELAATGHQHPFYYFVPNLVLGLAPWSVFLPALALFLYQRRHAWAAEDLLYPLVWFATVFVFFSAAAGKRSVYILPLYPAVALLFGAWWVRVQNGEYTALWLVRLGGYVGGALFLVAAGVLGVQALGGDLARTLRPVLAPTDQGQLAFFARCITEHAPAVWLWLGGVGLGVGALLWALHRERWHWVAGALVGLTAGSFLLVQSLFLPALARERTVKPFMTRVRRAVSDSAPLYFYRVFDHGALFYARRHIPEVGRLEDLVTPCFLLMDEDEWQRVRAQDKGGLTLLDTSEGTGPEGTSRLVLVAAVPQPRKP